MQLIVLTKDQWKAYSDTAHSLCFDETGFSEIETIDYALLVVKDEVPLMYATIRQHDAVTAYMSRGGAFPSVKGTALSYKAFEMILDYLKAVSVTITLRTLNTNSPMLKFAMKAGFVIEGISYSKKQIFLEHILEVNHVVGITDSNSINGCEQSGSSSEAAKGIQSSAG
jgi:hypothetical protein